MTEPERDEALLAVADELAVVGQRLVALSDAVRVRAAEPSGRPPRESRPVPPAEPLPSAGSTEVAEESESAEEPPPPDPGARWAPGRVLAWVGGAVTLLGVVFLLVLAAQRGWLSPAFRVIGGAGLGAALLGAGYWVHRRSGNRTGGSALAATGFAALYLDAVAATTLYGYLPVAGGLGAGFLIAGGGLLLADRWRAQPLAVGAVLGCAVCSPLIAQRPDAVLIGFLVLLQVAATPVQLRRGWSRLTVAAALPGVLAALIADAWALLLPADRLAIVVAVGVVALVGVVVATMTARVRPHDGATAIGMLVAAPAPVLLAAPLLERVAAGFLASGVAVLLLVLWGASRFTSSARLPARFVATAGAVGVVAVVQATMTFLDSSVWAIALLCEALLLTLAARRLRSGGALLGGLCYAAVGFCAALVHDIPPLALLDLSGAEGAPGALVGLLVAVTVVAIPATATRLAVLPGLPRAPVLWGCAGVLLLYATSSATMAVVLLAREDRTGFLAGHVLITLSWVVAAIVLLLRGIRVSYLRMAGMVLLPVALAKLFLFDLATLDGFARVVAFLCAGLVLLAAGVRYARLIAGEAND